MAGVNAAAELALKKPLLISGILVAAGDPTPRTTNKAMANRVRILITFPLSHARQDTNDSKNLRN